MICQRGTVVFSETDASGHYYWAHAVRWAENAEHAVLRAAGAELVNYPRRSVTVTFDRPLWFGDEYTVHLATERLGTTSITWRWQITRDDEICATGNHTIVHIGKTGRPEPIPDDVRSALAAMERTPS